MTQVTLHVMIHAMALRFGANVRSNLSIHELCRMVRLPVAEAEEIHSLHQTKLFFGIPSVRVESDFPSDQRLPCTHTSGSRSRGSRASTYASPFQLGSSGTLCKCKSSRKRRTGSEQSALYSMGERKPHQLLWSTASTLYRYRHCAAGNRAPPGLQPSLLR